MERTFAVQGPVDLDVRVASGEVVVDPTLEGSVEIELIGHDAESQKLVDGARVELRAAADRPQVVVDVPNRVGGFSLSTVFGRSGVSCRVRCPEGSSAEVRTKSADVTAGGRLGDANVTTASGDVEVRRADGTVTVKTASGDVSLEEAGGRVSVATASGDVGVRAVHGSIHVATASGDAGIGSADGDVRVDTASGDVRVGSVGSGQVGINSASGDVEIGVRRGVRAHLDCTTLSGDAVSELEADDTAAEGEGPLVEIRARTMSGDIRITRAQEVPA